MPEGSWLRLFIWLALGLSVHFLYAWRAGRFRAAEEELLI